MNIHEHPNTKEYLAYFLLTLRKHSVLRETTVFPVEVEEEGQLNPSDLSLLR